MAVETNARIEFSVASVEEWEKVNPKLHQGEPVFAKKPSGKYILKVGAPGGSTYKNAVVVWDQDDAETKMTSTQEAAAQALASKNAASASASAAKVSENAAATSKSAAATSEANAKTSETNAAASKTAAANSASTASAKATAAGNSASAAATSEKNAASSASAAATSESNALKSASAASTSAGNAKSSETNASASASAAKVSENAAATSKSAAATSAENAKTSETNASASANTAKAWSMSDSSPDGVSGNKSSKTWAAEAKASASNSAASASASQTSATASASSASNSANSANASKQSATASASSASAASSSASDAAASASKAKTSETNAANSAKAAKQSEENAKTWDPTQYVQSVTESNGKVTVTKGGGESTTFNAGLNILARNKSYSVGDIAYSPNLPSYLYLECTQAGTTGATEPDMSTVSGGVMVDDGTAKFGVKTVCAKEYVESKQNDLLSKIAYRAGDRFYLNSWYTVTGNVTNLGKDIIFVIPTSKVILASKMQINALNITVRQNNKYLIGSSSTRVDLKQYWAQYEYTEMNNSMFNCGIYICIKLKDAPSGIINNTPLSVVLGIIDISFYD